MRRLLLVAFLLLPASALADITTPWETIPDFDTSPTKTSAGTGNWNTAGTWTPSGVPGTNDVVHIANGHTVTVDTTGLTAKVIGVQSGGTLAWSTAANTSLSVGVLLVRDGGTLTIGTTGTPVPSGTTAELVIRNQALGSVVTDTSQHGTGLIVLGTLRIHGAAKTPTFSRTTVTPAATDTTFTLADTPTGWVSGDLLVIPDSRDVPDRTNTARIEERTYVSQSANVVTINSGLTYAHPCALDHTSTCVFRPHVMNLTRNVLLRSEDPAGTRGHVMITHRADADVRYAEFRDLGRTTISPLNDTTNHVGRYALHFHHVYGPVSGQANGFQFTAVGNAMRTTTAGGLDIKWPIAIHDSHYGLIQHNVVYRGGGSGLVTEDGSETRNVIDGNMACHVKGNGDREGRKGEGVFEPGSQGIGIWLHGPNNYVTNNVGTNTTESTDEAAYGTEMFVEFVGDVRIPDFQGADTSDADEYTLTSAYSIPILQWEDNEAYGTPQGMTVWNVGIDGGTAATSAESVIKDQKIWHISRYLFYGYRGNKVVWDGAVVINDPNQSGSSRRFWWGDYLNISAAVRNSYMYGFTSLQDPYASASTTVIRDSEIRLVNGVYHVTTGAPGDCPSCPMPNRRTELRNVTFGAVLSNPAYMMVLFDQDWGEPARSTNLNQSDTVYVFDHNGVFGANFQVFYPDQTSGPEHGGVATCTDDPEDSFRPEFYGITCPGFGEVRMRTR